MAAGTSSRLVPKRHLINMVAMYIPIIRRAVARRCRLEVDSPAGFEEFHDGFSELRCVESCGGLSLFSIPSASLMQASAALFGVFHEVNVCVLHYLSDRKSAPLQVLSTNRLPLPLLP